MSAKFLDLHLKLMKLTAKLILVARQIQRGDDDECNFIDFFKEYFKCDVDSFLIRMISINIYKRKC